MLRVLCHGIFIAIVVISSPASACTTLLGSSETPNRVEYRVKNNCNYGVQLNACTLFLKSGRRVRDGKSLRPGQTWTFSYVNFDNESTKFRFKTCRDPKVQGVAGCQTICPRAASAGSGSSTSGSPSSRRTKKSALVGTWRTRGRLKGQTMTISSNGAWQYTNKFRGGICNYTGNGRLTGAKLVVPRINGACRIAGRSVSASGNVRCWKSGATRMKCSMGGGKAFFTLQVAEPILSYAFNQLQLRSALSSNVLDLFVCRVDGNQDLAVASVSC